MGRALEVVESVRDSLLELAAEIPQAAIDAINEVIAFLEGLGA